METLDVLSPSRHARTQMLEIDPPPYFEFSFDPHRLGLIVDESFLFLQLTHSPRSTNCNRLEVTVDHAMTNERRSYAILEVPGTKDGTRWLIVSRPADEDPIAFLSRITELELRPVEKAPLNFNQLILAAVSVTAIIAGLTLFAFKRRTRTTEAVTAS
jgi:hypothetical protein